MLLAIAMVTVMLSMTSWQLPGFVRSFPTERRRFVAPLAFRTAPQQYHSTSSRRPSQRKMGAHIGNGSTPRPRIEQHDDDDDDDYGYYSYSYSFMQGLRHIA